MGGEGKVHKEYYTSLDQLSRKLRHKFSVRRLDLYCVFERQLQMLVSEDDLRRVVRPLENHGVLFISAFNAHENPDGPIQHQGKEGELDFVYPPRTLVREGTVNEVMAHFIVHKHSCCDCKKSPIRGVRYVNKENMHLCLCGRCYDKLERSNRKSWERRIRPWTYDAPAGPQNYGNTGEDVRQLQYLLTCLGYMRLSDTKYRIGYLGERTQAAIKKFRQKHGVHGGDLRFYDHDTAHRLARVVRKLRNVGHSYM